MLQERHITTDIAALHHEVGELLVRPDRNQIANLQVARRVEVIEADGRAGGGVPEQLRWQGDERGDRDADRGEVRDHDVAEAGHRSISRRLSHAWWRSIV